MDWQGSEKRRFVRANIPCKIIIRTPKEKTIVTQTENIGAGGVRVVIEESLDISSMVSLEVYVDDQTIRSNGRIAWMVPTKSKNFLKSKQYDTGIEFYEISSKDRAVIKELVEKVISKEK